VHIHGHFAISLFRQLIVRYWSRFPTGNEWLVQSIIGINHHALGIISWDDPTPSDIKSAASSLAKSLPSMIPFIFNADATFSNLTSNRIDVGLWTVGSQTLLLAANLNYDEAYLDLNNLPTGIKHTKVTQIFDGGAEVNG
jgi:hypothetical protein